MQDIDVGLEWRSAAAGADFHVESNVGRHVIVRKPDDPGRCRAFAADAAVGDPVLGRNQTLGYKQSFGLDADPVHVFDTEMVGEKNVLVKTMQPMRALAFGDMPDFPEAGPCDDRIASAEGNELARGQLRVTRERLKNITDVIVGNLYALGHRAAVEMRATFRFSGDVHTLRIMTLKQFRKRSECTV